LHLVHRPIVRSCSRIVVAPNGFVYQLQAGRTRPEVTSASACAGEGSKTSAS
jgi:hypothetical protein